MPPFRSSDNKSCLERLVGIIGLCTPFNKAHINHVILIFFGIHPKNIANELHNSRGQESFEENIGRRRGLLGLGSILLQTFLLDCHFEIRTPT